MPPYNDVIAAITKIVSDGPRDISYVLRGSAYRVHLKLGKEGVQVNGIGIHAFSQPAGRAILTALHESKQTLAP